MFVKCVYTLNVKYDVTCTPLQYYNIVLSMTREYLRERFRISARARAIVFRPDTRTRVYRV